MSFSATLLPLIETELQASAELIRKHISSQVPLAAEISDYVLKQGGKRLRPILVLLSTKLCEADPEAGISLAAVVEMLHTATLLHDDVIDESLMRRNQPSANAKFGNEASVLVGDLLYARAFQLITSLNQARVTAELSEATSVIVEGEIFQLAQKQDLHTDEATYLKIIRAKTGRLFRVAALAGPLLSPDNPPAYQALAHYGEMLGMAFQIQDDALDYIGQPETIGKNLGDDLAEGKLTLPLIYALTHAPAQDQNIIKAALTAANRDQLSELLRILASSGALDYTQAQARHYAEAAKLALSLFPPSPYRSALMEFANFSVERQF